MIILVVKVKNRIKKYKKFINTSYYKMLIYRLAIVSIDKSANIMIKNQFKFNTQWSDRKNNKSGRLSIDRHGVLKVDNFRIYEGSSIFIQEGAKLSLGTGYMNYDCKKRCSNSITIGNDVAISENVKI